MQNTGTCCPCRRQRLVCQEPGLGPIGRSPVILDKSSWGLGSMPRYSAQILICFYSINFPILFYSSVGLVGNFAGLPPCTVPLQLSIVLKMRLVIRQSKFPACLAEVQLANENTLWHLCHRTGENEIEICISGKLSVQEPSEWGFFCTPVSNFTSFQPRI